jgi:aspartate carbamoyltransferase catalytic subunit
MKAGSIKKIDGNYKDKDILSLDQFSSDDLTILFKHTKKMKKIAVNSEASKILAGTITTLLFYEPSSRTYGSFAAAIKQLGGQTIDILNPQQFSSVSKGETFEDTIRVFEAYCDVIVLRDKTVGQAQRAADAADSTPIVNAGDGIGEHPTQALLDMFTIFENTKRLDKLTGVLAGDLLNGRTVHSLIRGLSLYPNTTLYLLSPKELKLSKTDFDEFKSRKIKLVEIFSEKDMPKNADFWYWTRVQKERFSTIEKYEKVKNKFIVTEKLVKEFAGKNTILMHPLPRVGEIAEEVDADPRAAYLRSQIRNGMYIRMALIALILGKIK